MSCLDTKGIKSFEQEELDNPRSRDRGRLVDRNRDGLVEINQMFT